MPVVLKFLVLALAIWGQVLAFSRSGYTSASHLLFYTNISNVLSALLMAALLWHLLGGRALPRWLLRLRFVISAGILLTFVVFSLLLSSRMEAAYLLSLNNLLVHNLVPVLTCLDFILFPDEREAGLNRPVWGTLMPIAYFVLSILLMAAGVLFEGSPAPYFFLDYRENGWLSAGGGNLGVIWWFLILLTLQVLLAWLLLGLQRLVLRAKAGKEAS